MGGGMWTAIALILLYKLGWFLMLIISTRAFALWGIAAVFICRRNRQMKKNELTGEAEHGINTPRAITHSRFVKASNAPEHEA